MWPDSLSDLDKRYTPVLVRGSTSRHWVAGNILFICEIWVTAYLRFGSASEFCKAFCLQSVPVHLHIPTEKELGH